MSGPKICLIHTETGEEVAATLRIIADYSELALIEATWAVERAAIALKLQAGSVARECWPQSLHWSWAAKAALPGTLAITVVGLEVDGECQAMILTKTEPYRVRQTADRGKPLVYVDYVEAAPWNWSLASLSMQPRFKGSGTILMLEAVSQSIQEGFHGRVGLHALPQAERFYVHCGMTKLLVDPAKHNLAYFEFTREQAQIFIERRS
jgi:hypothetical protein